MTKDIDLAVAAHVHAIIEQCPCLRIITYHHLSWDQFGFLSETLYGQKKGVRALIGLTACLECICVMIGTWHQPLADFGQIVAPLEEWSIQALLFWPQVTLMPEQYS